MATKTERIDELERKLEAALDRIRTLEARPYTIVYPTTTPYTSPYTSPWINRTAAGQINTVDKQEFVCWNGNGTALNDYGN